MTQQFKMPDRVRANDSKRCTLRNAVYLMIAGVIIGACVNMNRDFRITLGNKCEKYEKYKITRREQPIESPVQPQTETHNNAQVCLVM